MASPLRPPTVPPPLRSRFDRGCPRAERSAGARGRRAVLPTCLVVVLALDLLGCARPEPRAYSAAEIERDHTAREALVASIADDHRLLADLISSERYAETIPVHTDPELREIALRLIERTRELAGLADTDFLAPGAP